MSTEKILIGLGGFFILLMFSFPFWYLVSPFYYTCESVKEGMSQQEAESILSIYKNNNRFEFYRGELNGIGQSAMYLDGIFISSKFLDMRCAVGFENNKVEDQWFYFD